MLRPSYALWPLGWAHGGPEVEYESHWVPLASLQMKETRHGLPPVREATMQMRYDHRSVLSMVPRRFWWDRMWSYAIKAARS